MPVVPHPSGSPRAALRVRCRPPRKRRWPAAYDDQGNYVYPDGFDPDSGEWLEGYDTQREEWERQYAEARSRFEAHRRQVAEARSKAQEEGEDAEGGGQDGEAGRSGSNRRASSASDSSDEDRPAGALASDEALAALRDKLSGGQS